MLSFWSFTCIIITYFISFLLSLIFLHNFSILLHNCRLLFIHGTCYFFFFLHMNYFFSIIYGFQFIIIFINIFIITFITNVIYLVFVFCDIISVFVILLFFFNFQPFFFLYVILVYPLHLNIITDIFIVINSQDRQKFKYGVSRSYDRCII